MGRCLDDRRWENTKVTLYLLICWAIFIGMILWGLYDDQQGRYATEHGPNMTSSVFWMITLLVSVPFLNLITFAILIFVALRIYGEESFDDDAF